MRAAFSQASTCLRVEDFLKDQDTGEPLVEATAVGILSERYSRLRRHRFAEIKNVLARIIAVPSRPNFTRLMGLRVKEPSLPDIQKRVALLQGSDYRAALGGPKLLVWLVMETTFHVLLRIRECVQAFRHLRGNVSVAYFRFPPLGPSL